MEKEYEIVNLVAVAYLEEQDIDLVSLSILLEEEEEKGILEVIYEPESFPGMTIKVEGENRVYSFLIFRSGKIVIAGAESEEKLAELTKWIKSLLEKYIKMMRKKEVEG